MKRVLTALVLIPLVVALIWWGPGWLLLLAVLPFVWVTLWEYFELAGRMGKVSNRTGAYIMALALCLVGWRQPSYVLVGLVGAGLLLLIGEAFLREDHSQVLPGAATVWLGLLYVVLPFVFLLDLRARPAGNQLVLLVLVLTWVGDISAYYGGRALGRHKLAPRISPGKTVEGAVASLVVTLAVGFWMVRAWLPDWAPVHAFALPLGLNLAAQAGDLVESALKRGAGVKDSSQLLPGHGGMLDRTDGLLLAIPTLWYYLFLVLPPWAR